MNLYLREFHKCLMVGSREAKVGLSTRLDLEANNPEIIELVLVKQSKVNTRKEF